MGKCFVIQPFDGAAFDKRFDDIIAPAITEAGLEPYRVDRDPAVEIPIQDIESGIKNSDVCLAEITTDNPNVWFEVGFAFGVQKEVVLVSSIERTKYPFDIQHRRIISYHSESPRDFAKLQKAITERLMAIQQKTKEISQVTSLTQSSDDKGLAPHEIVALVCLAQNALTNSEEVTPNMIKEDMVRAGFTSIATSLGLRSLINKGLAESREYNWNDQHYVYLKTTESGISWLLTNQDKLVLRTEKKTQPQSGKGLPF